MACHAGIFVERELARAVNKIVNKGGRGDGMLAAALSYR